MIELFKAIKKINPNAQVVVRGNDLATCEIEWHNCSPIPKEQIEGILPIVEFEIALDELRAKRNKALADSDWTQLPDVGFNAAERNAWMIYRQALRDITNNIETAEQAKSISFPVKP